MGLFDWLFHRSSPDRFAREVLGRLRAAGIRDATYHRDQFAIEYRPRTSREPTWMYLSNLYAECRQDPTNRIDRVERFVATFVSLPSMPETWDEAKSLLRPVLRGASFGRSAAKRRRPVLRRPALPYLDELVVVDQPTSMGYVAEGMWGVPAEQIFATARANLAAAPRPVSTPDPTPTVLRFFDSGDSYFVSRLLIEGWLASLADQVGGVPVAFVPDPTSLIVVADDPNVLDPLFEVTAEEYTQAPRALSPMGYTVDGSGRLVPYAVPADHPLAGVVARAERTLATVEYETQRSVLQEDEAATEYVVAGCALSRRSDGTAYTVATWSGELPALLPVVDYVEVGAVAEEAGLLVPWQALADEDLLSEAVEYRPTRYRVEGALRADVLARLAARAASL